MKQPSMELRNGLARLAGDVPMLVLLYLDDVFVVVPSGLAGFVVPLAARAFGQGLSSTSVSCGLYWNWRLNAVLYIMYLYNMCQRWARIEISWTYPAIHTCIFFQGIINPSTFQSFKRLGTELSSHSPSRI